MRILLADNRSRVRFALRSLLEEQSGLMVVGEVNDCKELLAQAEAVCPDLVLIDWDLPGMATVDLLTALQKTCPGLPVIALSSRPEVEGAALAAGAQAFVSKAGPPEPLLAAIQFVKDRCKGDLS
jgi:DNA-binding NarL/FixJ family response regulator